MIANLRTIGDLTEENQILKDIAEGNVPSGTGSPFTTLGRMASRMLGNSWRNKCRNTIITKQPRTTTKPPSRTGTRQKLMKRGIKRMRHSIHS